MNVPNIIKKAIESYEEGKLVAIPTETVYGLSAPIDDPELVNKIFSLKKRPFFDPLIVHGDSVERLKPLVKRWTALCDRLAKDFWPGPLTLVVPKNEMVSDLITAGLSTVGIRIPNSQLTIEFLAQLGRPVAAPSANMFTKISPTKAQDVMEVFDFQDVFTLDGGECQVGIESTILLIENDRNLKILRPGVVTQAKIEDSLKGYDYTFLNSDQQVQNSPGQFKEHYRPEKTVYTIFCSSREKAKELLKLKSIDVEKLSWMELSKNPIIAARELYSTLRAAASVGNKGIGVFMEREYLEKEAWRGVVDRLKKASGKVIIENK